MATIVNRISGQQLAQSRPSSTTAASIYAPRSQFRIEIRKFVVCNTSEDAATFRIFHDDNGSTYDETTALFWDSPIDAGETVTIEEEFWMIGRSQGNVAVRTSVSNALTFTVYGARDKTG
jgi:hypothetical protein